jgi:molybdopterin/thiamine biosynthesis adenylyltransferase
MARVVVVGAGNIGSHVLPHLARLPQITGLLVIDRDAYADDNVKTQAIEPGDVGQLKSAVQARLLNWINPSLEVTWLHSNVELVPLGLLRADVILACVDSRRARMAINQVAFRLGVPWIDAGVHADNELARVRAFMPGPNEPCLECCYTDADYAAVEQDYPCGAATPISSGATSHLGAMAASMQTLACAALLSGGGEAGRLQSEWLINARQRTHFVTSYRPNTECRMPDHKPWQITTLDIAPTDLRLRDALALGADLSDQEQLQFSVAHRQLVIGSGPFSLHDTVWVAELPESVLGHTLADLGVRRHDVITLSTSSQSVHFELGGAA